jgi:hypothetical protein
MSIVRRGAKFARHFDILSMTIPEQTYSGGFGKSKIRSGINGLSNSGGLVVGLPNWQTHHFCSTISRI